jgi:hypothetical protein
MVAQSFMLEFDRHSMLHCNIRSSVGTADLTSLHATHHHLPPSRPRWQLNYCSASWPVKSDRHGKPSAASVWTRIGTVRGAPHHRNTGSALMA